MNILTFSEKRVALAFSDYLRSLGIANHVAADGEGFSIILEKPEQSEQALHEAREFAAHPQDEKYWQASWQSGAVQQAPVYGEPASGSVFADWWQRGGWVTRATGLLCVLVYVALEFGGQPVFDAMSYPHAISVSAINGQWWRLLTPAIMHFGIMHIAFNLLWWWELGGLIERMQSGVRLLALAVVIALVSNAVQLLSYGPEFGGLSAVVYGLLGYLWLYPVADPNAAFRLRPAIVIFMLGWLALGYTGIFDMVFGHIFNNGHLAGVLTGAGLGLLLGLVNRRRDAAE